MGQRVLMEGSVLLDQVPSQARSYATGLASALRNHGLQTEIVLSTNRRISIDDAQLAEITIFDAPRGYNIFNQAGIALRQFAGAPFGYKPGVLEGVRGTVVGRDGFLNDFQRTHAIPNLDMLERGHFNRFGRAFTIKTDRRVDLFHCPRPAPMRVAGAPNVYTIRSLQPQVTGEPSSRQRNYSSALIAHLAKTADHIVTVTEALRQKIMTTTGIEQNRISDLSYPVSVPTQSEEDVADILRRYFGLDFGGYYLFAGTIEPSKNIRGLIEAYASAAVRRPLILTGGINWSSRADQELLNGERFTSYVKSGSSYGLCRSVQYLGPVQPEYHFALMRGARALLYPVLDDEFALPIAEALRLGTPVLTSAREALREMTGGAALYTQEADVESMAQAIRAVDVDSDLLAELAAKGRIVGERYAVDAFNSRLAGLLNKLI